MSEGPPSERQPGIIVIWSGSSPCLQVFPLLAAGLEVGRDLLGATDDNRISRRHARVSICEHTGTDPGVTRFAVTDLGSRNGTNLGGQPLVDRAMTVTAPAVVRAGRTVAVVLEDIRPFAGPVEVADGEIIGPSSRALHREVAAAAVAAEHLLLLGEDGAGKSVLAEHYARRRGAREARFNPTVHAVPLERVLGDASTLLLDDPGKLTAAHHEVLLRLLEEREALRVVTGAAQRLDQLGVPAPLAQLLSQRTCEVPPLRERPEELAYLIADAVAAAESALTIHASLIEMALLRPWPGNVRELITAITQAAHAVASQGKANLRGEDLDTEAGYLLAGAPTINASLQPTLMGARRRRRSVSKVEGD
jgi:transcriptional regulator of acetoin/glycerol metabolism